MTAPAIQNLPLTRWTYGLAPSSMEMVEGNYLWGVMRLAVQVLLRCCLRLLHRYRAHNAWQLRGLRGHLIVANHCSHLDALTLLAAFPLGRVNHVRSLCAKDYFFSNGLRQAIAFLLGNTIPMDRDRYDARAIDFCRRRIEAGDNVILFPEGTRGTEGQLGEFKAGVGLLATKYGWPILPAAIRGAGRCWRKGATFPRPGTIKVAFGRPVQYRLTGRRRDDWLDVAEDLRRRVGELAGTWDCAASEHEEETRDERIEDEDVEDVRAHAGSA